MNATPVPSTCDLCDARKGEAGEGLHLLPPVFVDFGGVPAFAGAIATVKCFEDNTSVREAVQEPGQGRVLVVDGAGSLRRALLGGNLAAAAAANGWAGIVVDGAVRDVAELRRAAVGIRALAAVPLATDRRAAGLRGVPVHIQGVRLCPGQWLVADADGIIVLDGPPA